MFIVVLVTAKNKREANRIAKVLVEEKLIACANIVTNVESIFRWQGKLDKLKEVLLILKTKKKNFQKLSKIIQKLHSYETPEIIALPIVLGQTDYLKWMDESTRGNI